MRNYNRDYAIQKAERYRYSDFLKDHSTDDACLEYMWQLRYGDMKVCPKCGKVARYYRIRKRKVYCCASCSHMIAPLAKRKGSEYAYRQAQSATGATRLSVWAVSPLGGWIERHGIPYARYFDQRERLSCLQTRYSCVYSPKYAHVSGITIINAHTLAGKGTDSAVYFGRSSSDWWRN